MSKKISRRKFLEMSATGAAGLVVAACTPAAPATPQVVEKQVEVTRIVAGTPVKETITQVVTATPLPTKAPEKVADVLGTFPRRETFIARILTFRRICQIKIFPCL